MSLFRTLKILCKIRICFQVVYIHLLNRWLYTAVATFKKLGNNIQLATDEISLMPRTSTRPSHLCFPMGLSQRAHGDFVELCVAQQSRMSKREFHWVWVVPIGISDLVEELLSVDPGHPPVRSYSKSKSTRMLERLWKAAALQHCHHWSQWVHSRAHREQQNTNA